MAMVMSIHFFTQVAFLKFGMFSLLLTSSVPSFSFFFVILIHFDVILDEPMNLKKMKFMEHNTFTDPSF